MDRRSELLARVPLFAGLDQRSLDAIATLAREVRMPAGSVLMQAGDPADAFYAIVSGTVHIERVGGIMRSLSDGGFFGEIALLEGGARTATATCATDCDLLVLGSFEFGRVTATFPDVGARIAGAAARRPHAT